MWNAAVKFSEHIDVVDYGAIVLSDSPDNVDMVRLSLVDETDISEAWFDLDKSEIDALVNALLRVRTRI